MSFSITPMPLLTAATHTAKHSALPQAARFGHDGSEDYAHTEKADHNTHILPPSRRKGPAQILKDAIHHANTFAEQTLHPIKTFCESGGNLKQLLCMPVYFAMGVVTPALWLVGFSLGLGKQVLQRPTRE